jgi:hypothetical protein
MLPQFWIVEVLRLSLMLMRDPHVQRASFPGNHSTYSEETEYNAAISIYESGSKDRTGAWLVIAEALWTSAGIPNVVVINGSLTRQTILDPYSGRFYKQHRIGVRLLEPHGAQHCSLG